MLNTMIVLLTLLTVSCGQIEAKGKGWEGAFNPYVSAFLMEAQSYNRKINPSYMRALTVQFGDPRSACGDERAVGCCNTAFGGRTVTVSEEFWTQTGVGYGEGRRYELIFHELGHCLLDFQHRGTMNSDTGRPTSVMYRELFDGNWFQSHINSYMDEFFSQ